jgi:hypothetical protein
MSDAQGIDAGLREANSFCRRKNCSCDICLRKPIAAPPDPRKDLAALEELADRWRSTGNLAANMPKHEYVSTVATGETLIACADALEQRLAEMRGAKR